MQNREEKKHSDRRLDKEWQVRFWVRPHHIE